MSALILDGKALSAKSEADLAARVAVIKDKNNGQSPILATILVGGRSCICYLCKDEAERLQTYWYGIYCR